MTLHQLDIRTYLAPATATMKSCWLAGPRNSAEKAGRFVSLGEQLRIGGSDPEVGT
jgi:hypothetical protein